MLDFYIVRPLDADQVLQAFPLIRALDPHLTLELWSRYAAPFVTPVDVPDRRRIITVQNEQGYIHGLAACRLTPDLHDKRTLDVENFVCLDLTGGRKAAAVLLEAAETTAQDWRCSVIRLSLLEPRLCTHRPYRPQLEVGLLEAAGYKEQPFRFSKSFAPAE